jgi:hypothetical protein
MATLKQIFELAKDTALLERVIASMRQQANLVMQEIPPDEVRALLAKAVLRNVYEYTQQFMTQAADTKSIQSSYSRTGVPSASEIDDVEIIACVKEKWSLIASLHFTPSPELKQQMTGV